MTFTLSLIILLGVQIKSSLTVKILCVYPTPSISHQIVYGVITAELLSRGHQLTVLTTDKLSDISSDNYTEINFHDISYGYWKEVFNFAMCSSGDCERPIRQLFRYKMAITELFRRQMQTSQVHNLLQSEAEFDLLIVESISTISLSIAHRYKNIPIISISTLQPQESTLSALGIPVHPILIPGLFYTHTGRMTLLQKIETLALDYFYSLYMDWSLSFKEDSVARELFGIHEPKLREIEASIDLLILDINPIVYGVRPTVPKVIYTGGLHLHRNKNPLPEHLKGYLDRSHNGLIYVSFGTNVVAKNMDSSTVNMILDVLKELPYNVLWKYEEGDERFLVDNIYIGKWFPQRELLGHKNVKLFISQCGVQSIDEAIAEAVPLICIPFLGDQYINSKRIASLDIGLYLDIQLLTKEQFKDAIETAIGKKRYKERMEKLGKMTYDEPLKPSVKAIWWIEYVIRNNGTKHLQALNAGVTLYEYYCVDVIIAVLIVSFVFTVSIILMNKIIFRKLFRKTMINNKKND